jgi:hypothetical protein
MAVGDEALYVADGRTALSITDGQILWRHYAKHPCAAPTVAGGRLLTTSGGDSGGLAVLSPQGESLGGLVEMLDSACEGLIVARGKIFAVERGRLLAVACKQ